MGCINYLSNGGKSFPKERVEVFCGGAVLQLDNFRILKGYGWRGFRKMKLFTQNKGQNQCSAAFIDSIVSGTEPPIPHSEIFEVSRVSIAISELLCS